MNRWSQLTLTRSRRRSIVAGDMDSNAGPASSVITGSWKRPSVGTNSVMIAASRCPVGAPSTAQHHPAGRQLGNEVRAVDRAPRRSARGRTTGRHPEPPAQTRRPAGPSSMRQ